MHCPECDVLAETEFAIKKEQEEAERTAHYFPDDMPIDGPWEPEEVGGDPVDRVDGVGGTEAEDYEVRMRVDLCANCGTYLRARTYAVQIS